MEFLSYSYNIILSAKATFDLHSIHCDLPTIPFPVLHMDFLSYSFNILFLAKAKFDLPSILCDVLTVPFPGLREFLSYYYNSILYFASLVRVVGYIIVEQGINAIRC